MASDAPLQSVGDAFISDSSHISALQLLVAHPIPVIAVADDGTVLFANSAFAEVLSCSRAAVTAISYDEICTALPTDETFFAATEISPDSVARLLRLGRATLFVKIHRSAILSGADSAAVALFDRLMRRLSQLAEPPP